MDNLDVHPVGCTYPNGLMLYLHVHLHCQASPWRGYGTLKGTFVGRCGWPFGWIVGVGRLVVGSLVGWLVEIEVLVQPYETAVLDSTGDRHDKPVTR